VSVLSARRTTDGTSAQLTNQSVPVATVRAADQPPAERSANRNVALSPLCSTQLSNTPSFETDNCGCPLPAAAGETSGSTWSAQDGVVCPGVANACRARKREATTSLRIRGMIPDP